MSNRPFAARPQTQPLLVRGFDELRTLVGTSLGRSPWLLVDQAIVDRFASVTRDEQWIHVDPERAATGPFGTTIAHGYLTLSLCSYLVDAVFEVSDVAMAINYGIDKLRFPSPVPTGSRIRAAVELTSLTNVPGGVQAVVHTVIEIDGSDKPACVADLVFRYYADDT